MCLDSKFYNDETSMTNNYRTGKSLEASYTAVYWKITAKRFLCDFEDLKLE